MARVRRGECGTGGRQTRRC